MFLLHLLLSLIPGLAAVAVAVLPARAGLARGDFTSSQGSLAGVPIPIIQVKKWGLGEVEELPQSPTAAGRWNWDGTLEVPCQSLSAVLGELAWGRGTGRWGSLSTLPRAIPSHRLPPALLRLSGSTYRDLNFCKLPIGLCPHLQHSHCRGGDLACLVPC